MKKFNEERTNFQSIQKQNLLLYFQNLYQYESKLVIVTQFVLFWILRKNNRLLKSHIKLLLLMQQENFIINATKMFNFIKVLYKKILQMLILIYIHQTKSNNRIQLLIFLFPIRYCILLLNPSSFENFENYGIFQLKYVVAYIFFKGDLQYAIKTIQILLSYILFLLSKYEQGFRYLSSPVFVNLRENECAYHKYLVQQLKLQGIEQNESIKETQNLTDKIAPNTIISEIYNSSLKSVGLMINLQPIAETTQD